MAQPEQGFTLIRGVVLADPAKRRADPADALVQPVVASLRPALAALPHLRDASA